MTFLFKNSLLLLIDWRNKCHWKLWKNWNCKKYKDDIIIIQRRHCCLALFATPNTLVKFPEYESPGINDDTSTIIAKFTGIIYKVL